MAICEETDLLYPLLADIFYPVVEQGAYGNVKKQWILDKTVACALNPAGRKFKQDVSTDPAITIDNSIVGRVRADILSSDREELNSMTNVLIANIRDRFGNIIYNESAGVRKGKSTIYELATINPIVGAFGTTEYYKIVIRRSENQAADV